MNYKAHNFLDRLINVFHSIFLPRHTMHLKPVPVRVNHINRY